MIVFQFADKTYKLEFERKRKEKVIVFSRQPGTPEPVQRTIEATNPTTTATLSLVSPGASPILITKYKVGCHPTDKFSLEKGRIEALRGLGKNFDKLFNKEIAKDLRAAVWDAYAKRNAAPKVKTEE